MSRTWSTLVGVVGLGLALADRHDAAHLALRAALQPDEEPDDQQHRQEDRQDPQQPVVARCDERELDVVLDHQLLIGVGDPRLGPAGRGVLVAVGELTGDLPRSGVDLGGRNIALDHLCTPLGVLEGFAAVARPQARHEERRCEHADQDPDGPSRPAAGTAPTRGRAVGIELVPLVLVRRRPFAVAAIALVVGTLRPATATGGRRRWGRRQIVHGSMLRRILGVARSCSRPVVRASATRRWPAI
jgi:hypothetical protein